MPFSDTTSLPGGQSEREPPDPIPTSEVKPLSADDSVDPHAKVGNRQALIPKPLLTQREQGFYFVKSVRIPITAGPFS